MIRFVLVLLVVAACAHTAHRWMNSIEVPESSDPHETFPSVGALELMSLGYDNLVADYYWMRAISDYGDIRSHRLNYPNLEPMLRRTLALDPYFAAAYIMAGTVLTTNDMDKRPSVELLEPGLEYRPDQWRIAFLLGFNAYYFLDDYAYGARVLNIAARHPDAPDYVGPLATRVAAEAGTPELALSMLDAVIPTIDDEATRERYLDQRKRLVLELQLKSLARALDHFETQHDRRAVELSELVTSGIVPRLPEDPLGGRFFINKSGEIATTSESERLRINRAGLNPEFQ